MSPYLAFIFLFVHLIPSSEPHGRLLEPPMRASIWRFEEFQHLDPPVNYDDDAFWCGSMSTQYDINKGRCGLCGDDFRDPLPRSHEDGGKYGRGILVRKYTSGQTIPLTVELTGAHGGYFEFHLCPRNSTSTPETDHCYATHTLPLSTGTTRLPVSNRLGLYHTRATLPPNLTCTRCALRWHYRVANNWGQCPNGTWAVGCGNQETFRGCADIAIL